MLVASSFFLQLNTLGTCRCSCRTWKMFSDPSCISRRNSNILPRQFAHRSQRNHAKSPRQNYPHLPYTLRPHISPLRRKAIYVRVHTMGTTNSATCTQVAGKLKFGAGVAIDPQNDEFILVYYAKHLTAPNRLNIPRSGPLYPASRRKSPRDADYPART